MCPPRFMSKILGNQYLFSFRCVQVCVHIGRCTSNKTILDLYKEHYVMVQYINTDNNEKTVIQAPVSYNLKGMLMEFKKEPSERQIRSSWIN